MKKIMFVCTLVMVCLFVGGAVAAENFPIKVTTTLQSSNGLTESDMDMEMLSAQEKLIKTDFLDKSKQSFVRQGYPEYQFDGGATSTSHYVIRSGKKLGIVNVSGFMKSTNQTVIQMIKVFGFVDEGMATVGCLRLSDKKIPFASGVCGEKVNDVFFGLPSQKKSNDDYLIDLLKITQESNHSPDLSNSTQEKERQKQEHDKLLAGITKRRSSKGFVGILTVLRGLVYPVSKFLGMTLPIIIIIFFIIRKSRKKSMLNGDDDCYPASVTMDDISLDGYFEKALAEYDNKETIRAIHSRAIVEANGEQSREKAIYIKLRVEQLKKLHQEV